MYADKSHCMHRGRDGVLSEQSDARGGATVELAGERNRDDPTGDREQFSIAVSKMDQSLGAICELNGSMLEFDCMHINRQRQNKVCAPQQSKVKLSSESLTTRACSTPT